MIIFLSHYGECKALAEDSTKPFKLRISSSDEVFEIPAHRTIVDVLLDHGIEIPVSCEQGMCGTCITKVIRGIPDHRDLFLSNGEHEANDQMTPCCSRSLTKFLTLDL